MQLASLPSLQWWIFLGQPHRHRFELISTKKWCCTVFTIWVVGCCLVSVPTWWCHSVLLAEPLELMVNSFRFCSWSFLVWFLWVATMWWQYYPNFCLARFSYGWVQNSWHFGCGTLYAFCKLMSIALCGPWFLWNSADEGSSFLLSIHSSWGIGKLTKHDSYLRVQWFTHFFFMGLLFLQRSFAWIAWILFEVCHLGHCAHDAFWFHLGGGHCAMPVSHHSGDWLSTNLVQIAQPTTSHHLRPRISQPSWITSHFGLTMPT